jgi:hypothetical protein
MPAYDAGFDPPAAVARALVIGPRGRSFSDVPLLIDSGSDATVVPRHAAEAVDALIALDDVTMAFYDGSSRRIAAAELLLVVEGLRFRGRFLVADAEHGILGRNVLNSVVTTLNGPRQSWELRRA